MRAFLILFSVIWIGNARADDVPRGPLPADVTPTQYSLDLTVLPDQERFSGIATIDARANTRLDRIWLHGQNLTVEDVSVTDATGERLAGQWQEIADTDGVARIGLPRAIAPGAVRIAIRYTAAFSRQLEGFYRAQEAGEHYVFSQMEPISARRAFPSFDDPQFKTPFEIAVTVRGGDVAVSNAPALNEEPRDGGLKRVQFATTKPMPTYLVALAVGPLDVVTWSPIRRSAIRDREIPLRGVAAKGKGAKLHFALSNTAGLLRTLEEYFGTPYPYEKLDIIAAIDFSAGAMENAGAIVYRESIILLDDSASIAQKRSYALTHAHEMAHQWFGNLVTPKWWNDIWLNEAFATWMEHRATFTWDRHGGYDRLTVADTLSAMDADSSRSVRRIAEPIKSNGDIMNAFDGITYEKGGGVLAMFEQYAGAEKFQKGVQLYLQRHAWGSATADDFLRALADGIGDPTIPKAFRSFLDQAGVPTIHASTTCSGGKATVQLRQSRFLRSQTDIPRSMRDQRWSIPLCIAYGEEGGRAETCALVSNARQSVKLPICPAWILPNAQGSAYARFSLSPKDWDGLIAANTPLNDKELLVALDSLDAGFAGGTIDLKDYLIRLRALLIRSRDELPIVSDVARQPVGRLRRIKDVIVPEEHHADLERYIRNIYGPWARELGLTDSSSFDMRSPIEAALLRPTVVTTAALHGRVQTLRDALRARAMAFLADKAVLTATEAGYIETALAIAVEDDGAAVVPQILARLGKETSGTTRQRLLSALSHSVDPAITPQIRALAFDKALRVNEVLAVVRGAFLKTENTAAAWAWFKENFDTIVERSPYFGRDDLAGIGWNFCTPALRDDYRAFFKTRLAKLTGGERIYAATMEQMDACIAISAAQRPKAAEALAAVR